MRHGEEDEQQAGHTDGSHAVMKTAWSQPALGYLKAPALPKQHVACWHSHILSDRHFVMTIHALIDTAIIDTNCMSLYHFKSIWITNKHINE